ncbi:MAG: hypothetical protein H5T68_11895 [Chloroflexi bacterium]|jgi:virulence-associated protein VagC|nr:hypothetical protein [Chloroflexota bacterium]
MFRRNKPQPVAKPLEWDFYRYFLRLSEQEQRRILEDLSQPFQRLWLIVDAQGVRRLEE